MGERRGRRTVNSQFGYQHKVSKDTTKFMKKLKVFNVFEPICRKCVKMGQVQSCREVNNHFVQRLHFLLANFLHLLPKNFSPAPPTNVTPKITSLPKIAKPPNRHVRLDLPLAAKNASENGLSNF